MGEGPETQEQVSITHCQVSRPLCWGMKLFHWIGGSLGWTPAFGRLRNQKKESLMLRCIAYVRDLEGLRDVGCKVWLVQPDDREILLDSPLFLA